MHLLEVVARDALGAIARDTTAHGPVETQVRVCDPESIIAVALVVLDRLSVSLFQSHLERRTLEAASIDDITHGQWPNNTVRLASDEIIAVVAQHGLVGEIVKVDVERRVDGVVVGQDQVCLWQSVFEAKDTIGNHFLALRVENAEPECLGLVVVLAGGGAIQNGLVTRVAVRV